MDKEMQKCRNEEDMPCPTVTLCDRSNQCLGHKIGLLVICGVPQKAVDMATKLCAIVHSQAPIDLLMQEFNVSYSMGQKKGE